MKCGRTNLIYKALVTISSAWKSGKKRDDERGRKSNGGASKRWIFPRIYKKALLSSPRIETEAGEYADISENGLRIHVLRSQHIIHLERSRPRRVSGAFGE
jgi:hypothetical protein